MKRHDLSIAATGLAVIVLFTGCGGDSQDSPETPATTAGEATPGESATTSEDSTGGGSTASEDTGTPTGGALGDVAHAVAALQTAAAAVPNGQPFDMETESHQGQHAWEIKVASDGQQHTVYLSMDGSRVISQRQDEKPDDDVMKLQAAQLDAVEALKAAVDQQGGTLSEMEIDSTRDGTVVWQVELRQSDGSVVELNLDAASGEVVGR